MEKKYNASGFFLLLILITLALRLPGIVEKSLWLDECYSLLRASVKWSNFLTNVAQSDAHPPLYYALTKVWHDGKYSEKSWIRGNAAGETKEAWLRFPSLILGIATVLLIYLTLLIWLPPVLAFFLSSLAMLSCFMIQISQEARHYPLSLFIGALATYALLGLLHKPHKQYIYSYFIAVLLGLYTFYYLAFLFFVHGIILIVEAIRRPKFRPFFWQWCILQSVAILFFLPWAIQVIPLKMQLFEGASPQLQAQGQLTLMAFWNLIEEFFLGEKISFLGKTFLAKLLLLLLLYQCYWRYQKKAKHRKFIWVLLASLLGPIAIIAIFPFKGHIFQSRHLVFLVPSLYILLALCVDPKKKWCWAIVLLFIFGNIVTLSKYYPRQKQAWRSASNYIYKNIEKREVVCFSPFYLHTPFAYYYINQGKIKPFFLGLSLPGKGNGQLPLSRQKYAYVKPEHVKRTRNYNFWLIEVENSPVAPAHTQLKSWCKRWYHLKSQKRFKGILGTIVVYRYTRKR